MDVDVSSRGKTSLGACLNTLPGRETIDDYKCSDIRRNGKDRGCGKIGKVEKTTYLKEEPEYLAVHLARMVGTDKCQSKVTFPTEAIDLSHLAGPDPALRQKALSYEVIGIVEHKGTPYVHAAPFENLMSADLASDPKATIPLSGRSMVRGGTSMMQRCGNCQKRR